jgi:hypothetical protein
VKFRKGIKLTVEKGMELHSEINARNLNSNFDKKKEVEKVEVTINKKSNAPMTSIKKITVNTEFE